MTSSFDSPTTFVELTEVDGEWAVRVVENKETIDTFPREAFAMSYAEDQRLRLGLELIQFDSFAADAMSSVGAGLPTGG